MENEDKHDKAGRAEAAVVRLDQIAAGGRFRLAADPAVVGRLIQAHSWGAQVELEGGRKEKEFETSDGERVRVKTKARQVTWSAATQVVEIEDDGDGDGRTTTRTKEGKMGNGKTVEGQLRVRWGFQVQQLAEEVGAGAGAESELAASIRERIRKIATEATAAGVRLPRPRPAIAADAVFGEAEVERVLAASGAGSAGTEATEAMEAGAAVAAAAGAGRARVPNSNKSKEKVNKMKTSGKKNAKKSVTAKGKKSVAAARRAPKELNDCLCGCGEQVTGKFRMGHDQRYKGIILRVERGEIKVGEIPGKMQQDLEFKANGKGEDGQALYRCLNPQAKMEGHKLYEPARAGA